MERGFDISYVQRNKTLKDFQTAAKTNQFVIIRLGTVLRGCLYKDEEFESKYKLAHQAGLKVGIYFYSMAKSVTNAEQEATFVVKQLNKRKLEYPVFIDFEDPSQANLGKDLSTAICNKFCEIISKAGYAAGVYASYNFLNNKLNTIPNKYTVWLAQYPKATYKGRYEMHQYGSNGEVPGFGKIDVNTSELNGGKYPISSMQTVAKPPKSQIAYLKLPTRGYFKQGDKGTEVKRLQLILNEKGFNCGKADGIFGTKTLDAVKKFQKSVKLTVDGLFGKKSLEAFKRKYGERN